MKRTVLMIGSALLTVLVFAGTAIAVTAVKIIDTKADEVRPSVTDGWVAWAANSVARPNAFHAYVRTGGSITKIPIRGDTFLGNIITDGTHAGQVVVMTNTGGDGNIRFYDLTTGAVSKPPAGVNTSKNEVDPFVSGDFLVFVRGSGNLMLYQFSTATMVKLVTGGVYHPQVNGDYVAYSRCGTKNCKSVYRYQISTTTTMKMPAPAAGRANYYAAVGSDGTMFWVEGSATACGKNTKIIRWVSGTESTVWKAPAGNEIAGLQADVLNSTPTLAFAGYDCAKGDFGAYRVSA